MKEFVEKYRPVRQRTVRKQTTKDKGGALPPAVYTRQQDFNNVDLVALPGNYLTLRITEGSPVKKNKPSVLSIYIPNWGCSLSLRDIPKNGCEGD